LLEREIGIECAAGTNGAFELARGFIVGSRGGQDAGLAQEPREPCIDREGVDAEAQ